MRLLEGGGRLNEGAFISNTARGKLYHNFFYFIFSFKIITCKLNRGVLRVLNLNSFQCQYLRNKGKRKIHGHNDRKNYHNTCAFVNYLFYIMMKSKLVS